MRKKNYRPVDRSLFFRKYRGYFSEKSMVNVEYLCVRYHYLYGIVFLKIIFALYEAGVKYRYAV